MSEIPADVMKAAEDAATAAVYGMCMTDDHSFGLLPKDQAEARVRHMSQIAYHDVRPAIARAILAERERCAKVADDLRLCSHEYEEDVAEAIRKGGANA